MGQLLSHPIEEKKIEQGAHDTILYAVGSMQGYRMTMEDAHAVKISADEQLAVFGVFDGHGGRQVADYVADKLPSMVFRQLTQAGPQRLSHRLATIKDVFFAVDAQLRRGPYDNIGLTGNLVIIEPLRLVVANTGDLRSVACVGGRAKPLLFDHKPVMMGERVRIENANGYIANARINEILALLRAFGDFKFKLPKLSSSSNHFILQNLRKMPKDRLGRLPKVEMPPELWQVTVEPDIISYDFGEAGVAPEFVVCACDGIWDCYKNQDLVALILHKIAVGWLLLRVVEHVLHELLASANLYTGIGFDNMTLFIIALHRGMSYEEWATRVRRRVERERGL